MVVGWGGMRRGSLVLGVGAGREEEGEQDEGLIWDLGAISNHLAPR